MELIPRLHDLRRRLYQTHWLEPELCHHSFALDVNVRRFVPIVAREEEAIRSDDSELHERILSRAHVDSTPRRRSTRFSDAFSYCCTERASRFHGLVPAYECVRVNRAHVCLGRDGRLPASTARSCEASDVWRTRRGECLATSIDPLCGQQLSRRPAPIRPPSPGRFRACGESPREPISAPGL